MRVSAVEDYSLRCLSHLARHPGSRLTIAAIAAAEGLSEENAAKVLARLRQAGLVQSFRGKDGGYVLARAPSAISLGEVLGDIGGRIFEVDRCHGTNSDPGCVHQGNCGIRPVWMTLGSVVHAFLSSITLADLVHPEDSVRQRLGTIIDSLGIAGEMRGVPAGDSRSGAVQPLQNLGTVEGSSEMKCREESQTLGMTEPTAG